MRGLRCSGLTWCLARTVSRRRHLAPANSPACVQLKSGDGTPLHQQGRSRMFVRFEMSVAKKLRVA